MNATTTAAPVEGSGLFGWWRDAPPEARRALVAAGLGWMLDAFDVMLYALVIAALIHDLGITPATAGMLGSLTLLASAAGGLAFGVIADKYGRTRALMWSIALYSIFTFACGLARNVTELAIYRMLLGLGMGGEWASGAALVSETWPAQHRGKALGLMQSAWAIGYGVAAAVTGIVLPRFGWRAVFFIGIVPALLTLWVRRAVHEPAIWREAHAKRATARPTFTDIFRGRLGALTVVVILMNACTMFAWWGFNLWIPTYLVSSPSIGGVGLSTEAMAGLLIAMQVGMWFGYVTFGFISDIAGRRPTYIFYLVAAAVLVYVYSTIRIPAVLLLLGPLAAFFGTGYFSGFAAVTAEIYPTAIRATAQGFTYNVGRVVSAIAPWVVGALAQTRGFSVALSTVSVAFVAAALFWLWIPDTRGRELEA